MKFTVNELAAHLNIPYQVAYGLISYLRLKDLAKEVGTRSKGGKGRGSIEYEIPERVELDFAKAEPEAEEKAEAEPEAEEKAEAEPEAEEKAEAA